MTPSSNIFWYSRKLKMVRSYPPAQTWNLGDFDSVWHITYIFPSKVRSKHTNYWFIKESSTVSETIFIKFEIFPFNSHFDFHRGFSDFHRLHMLNSDLIKLKINSEKWFPLPRPIDDDSLTKLENLYEQRVSLDI